MKIKQVKDSKIIPWIGIVVVLYMMTLLEISMGIKNLFLVITTSVCSALIWKDNSEMKWEVPILILGLIARVAFCYLDIYAEFDLPIGGGSDSSTFMKTAVEYYYGDFSRKYTNYPYVLYTIFQITGINQFAAQYVNILCWGFGALVLQKSCKRLNICGIFRVLALVIMACLPTNIWITSILYRDTYVMLFLFMSFYFLICWMQEARIKNVIYSIGTVLLASWLHGGSIVALVPIVITIVFYSNNKKQFVFTKRNVAIAGVMVIVALLAFMVPQIREIFFRKIPYLREGLVTGINNFLEMKYDYSEGAGSNYMVGRYLTGYFDIVIMTFQRIYYHMFSPVPHMWRGIMDAVSFWGSTAPVYLAATILWFVSVLYQKKEAYRFVLFMEIFITVGIYAWANVNAGAALRHREKIIGLVILMAIYSLNIIIQRRKERKNIEKITDNER